MPTQFDSTENYGNAVPAHFLALGTMETHGPASLLSPDAMLDHELAEVARLIGTTIFHQVGNNRIIQVYPPPQ
jgi:creatinine amidohydrolase/Fe(II)-dependent formamide hydrolase-like protein